MENEKIESMVTTDEFMRMYQKKYDALYRSGRDCSYDGFMFDLRMKVEPEFHDAVLAFAGFRMDPITSDRECAAFTFAYIHMLSSAAQHV